MIQITNQQRKSSKHPMCSKEESITADEQERKKRETKIRDQSKTLETTSIQLLRHTSPSSIQRSHILRKLFLQNSRFQQHDFLATSSRRNDTSGFQKCNPRQKHDSSEMKWKIEERREENSVLYTTRASLSSNDITTTSALACCEHDLLIT
jgi:hypothetical protein